MKLVRTVQTVGEAVVIAARLVGVGIDAVKVSTPVPAPCFKVGTTVEVGSWQVTVLSAENPYESPAEFDKPEPGMKFVTASIEIVNESKPRAVSSTLSFKLRDITGHEHDDVLLTGVPGPPEGDVSPGQALLGTLSYQVPHDASGLLLVLSCDLLDKDSATIAIP
ncbi:MAG: DUF4352 domain-containing protein [Actinomycetes bacterium]